MKKFFHPKYLPWFVLGSGILCALVRWWLFATGTDHKGLLDASHPGNWLTWVITLLAFACIVIGTGNLQQATKYRFNFPASTVSAIGILIAAAGFAVTSLRFLVMHSDSLAVLAGILGLVAAVALGYLGVCRQNGDQPSMLFHATVCIYLMIFLVWQYRAWSSDPQIQDYCFSLLATVSLMLACYYSSAFDTDTGSRQPHALFHLLAVYFCFACLPYCAVPWFYLPCGIWMLTDLCNMTPMPREAR